MPRKTPDLTFRTDDKVYDDLGEALQAAAKRSLQVVDGKFTTVLVYAATERAAVRWGGQEALEKFRAHAADYAAARAPLASIQVKAQPSYWL